MTSDLAAKKLRLCLKTLLMAIEECERVGCIDHLDCWDDVSLKWYGPIEQAKDALKETEDYST